MPWMFRPQGWATALINRVWTSYLNTVLDLMKWGSYQPNHPSYLWIRGTPCSICTWTIINGLEVAVVRNNYRNHHVEIYQRTVAFTRNQLKNQPHEYMVSKVDLSASQPWRQMAYASNLLCIRDRIILAVEIGA